MSTYEDAVKSAKKFLNTRQRELPSWPAFLGNEDGTVQGSEADKVYVRYPSITSPAVEVYNGGVPLIAGLRVMVGSRPETPTRIQALGIADIKTTVQSGIVSAIRPHASQHLWGYTDPVYILTRQILNLGTYSNNNLTVTVKSGVYTIAGTILSIADTIVDLTSHVPGSGALYALLSLDDTGSIDVTDGGTVGTPDSLSVSNIPATPAGNYAIAAVRLFDGQTVIRDTLSLTDIVDLRFFKEVETQRALGWFNVLDYGATGDGSTDDTAAIQDTIDAAVTAGGGVVYFPSGVYIVAGARQDGARGNAQIIFPALHLDNDNPISIYLLGETPAQQNVWIAGSGAPSTGAIIRSTLTTSTGGALLGGWGPSGSFDDFTNITVKLENLVIETPSNPVITGVDLSHVLSADVCNIMINAGGIYGYQDVVQPTTSTSYGLRMPATNNGTQSTARGVVCVMGFYNGVEVSEHFNAEQLDVFTCLYATIHPATGHSIWMNRLLIQWCAHGLKFNGAQHILIGVINFEHYNPGLYGSKWFDPIDDISDSSNYAIGRASYHATLAGTGADESITIVGASNFQVTSIHDSLVSSITAGTGLTATPNPIVRTGTLALNAALDDLNNVTAPSPSTNDVIAWNGAVWLQQNPNRLIDRSWGSMYQDDVSTVITISATNTDYIVTGMSVGALGSMTFQNSKELVIALDGVYQVSWSISFTAASANQEIEGAVGVGGVRQANTSAHSKIATGTDTVQIGGTGLLSLVAGNLVQLTVRNETGTNNITIEHANISLVYLGLTTGGQMLIETGDALLLETGDNLLMEG